MISVTLISSAMGGGQYGANFSIRQVIYYILSHHGFLNHDYFSKKIKTIHIYYIFYFLYLLIGYLSYLKQPLPVINGAKVGIVWSN